MKKERLDLLLGDGEVESPHGGGYSEGLCVFCPLGVWRYRPVLWSVSPPDYLSLLTSLHPLEDRDTVEVWTFHYYQYFIFRFDHFWRQPRGQCWPVSGGLCALHRPTLSAA